MFRGNGYWNAAGPVRIADGDEAFDSLDAWRKATGQERDGPADTGTAADPRLTDAGQGGTLEGKRRFKELDAYRLRPDSPLRGAGVTVEGLGDFPPVGHDFFGAAVKDGERRSVGVSN